jgi:oligopeptidase A
MELSLFDMLLHKNIDPNKKNQAQDILDTVRKDVSVIPTPPENRFQNNFSHIFSGGYAAGYYGYMWAELLSSDVYSKFEENGYLDGKTGQEFLSVLLSQGGSAEPMDLFVKFRGRKPSIDALLRHNGIVGRVVE